MVVLPERVHFSRLLVVVVFCTGADIFLLGVLSVSKAFRWPALRMETKTRPYACLYKNIDDLLHHH